MYIFSKRLFLEPFSFKFKIPRYYLDLFRFAKYLNFGILRERGYLVGLHTPKHSRIGHCIFFLTDYIPRKFAVNIGVPR